MHDLRPILHNVCATFVNSVFVPCAQRDVQVSVTTMEGALWKPMDGTASVSQDGEGLGVMLPWKHFALMARTMKEVYLCVLLGIKQELD